MTDITSPHETEPDISQGIDNQKLGIWILIGSEVVFFSALIVTYIVLRGRSITGPFPQQVLDIPLTAVNTFVLICSSLTMVSGIGCYSGGLVRRMQVYWRPLWFRIWLF